MAWNQPGGNGNKDPWGGRGGQQGPPDLDEVLKKLRNSLSKLLGGGGSGGGSGPSGIPGAGIGGTGIVVILVVVILGWALWGLYIVEPPEKGVVLRFGKFVGLSEPGPHWIARPFYDVETIDVSKIHTAEIGFRSSSGSNSSVPHESLMLTQDENIIDIKFAVLYRVSDPDRYLFNVLDPDNTLRQATEAAVREIVGRSTLDVITEGRALVSTEARGLIQEFLDSYGEGGAGLIIRSVNMQEAQPPREVQDAFEDAVRAREDEERFKNEARAYAADVLPKARGDANTIRESARAYEAQVVAAAEGESSRFLKVFVQYQKAPEVTRQRLYLEAVESVMANSTKVLMDVEGGNNLMYLPIDKLIGRGDDADDRGSASQFGDNSSAIGAGFGDNDTTDERARSRE
jgi:membrane protease subunit HflK